MISTFLEHFYLPRIATPDLGFPMVGTKPEVGRRCQPIIYNVEKLYESEENWAKEARGEGGIQNFAM